MNPPIPIASSELRIEQIPSDDAFEMDYIWFALSFDGYAHWGSFDQCSKVAQEIRNEYEETGTLPASLDALRTALFFKQRAARHVGTDFSPIGDPYVGALLAVIRQQVIEQTS